MGNLHALTALKKPEHEPTPVRKEKKHNHGIDADSLPALYADHQSVKNHQTIAEILTLK